MRARVENVWPRGNPQKKCSSRKPESGVRATREEPWPFSEEKDAWALAQLGTSHKGTWHLNSGRAGRGSSLYVGHPSPTMALDP